MKKWQKFLLIVLISMGALLGAAVIADTRMTRPAEPLVSAYLESSNEVSVSDERWLVFRPADEAPQVGFIFYPGGKVDHLAYAPTMYEIAAQGYLVVNVPMPSDLAVLAPNRAERVMAAFPEIEYWVIGGHSLGAAMAARFVYEHPEMIDGLVLWAGYPADSNSLARFDLPVVSIYGTLDGVARPTRIERTASLLPAEAVFYALEGGNHAQFGFYGPQRGDNPASISREQQQAEIIAETVHLLASLDD